jgi:hypothetical protein
MVLRTIKLGTADVRRVVVVASSHLDARAGVGALCVVIMMTEGAYVFLLLFFACDL